jgi:hypothetical protein
MTLACFFAMFAEALSVYFAIVIVFDSHVSHIVVKVALFCWGKFSGFEVLRGYFNLFLRLASLGVISMHVARIMLYQR